MAGGRRSINSADLAGDLVTGIVHRNALGSASETVESATSTTSSTTDGPSTFLTLTASRQATTKLSSAPAKEVAPTTSIQWGPAITAAPLPSAKSTPEVSSIGSQMTGQDSHFSNGQRQVTIATSVIGGTFILALLIYALCRRRKGATLTEIVRFRPHSGTIVMTPTPRTDHFTALPIQREYRYSVRSSRHQSTVTLPRASRYAPEGIPAPVAHRFHHQNPYIKSLWKTGQGPPPATPSKVGQSFLADASPPPPPPKIPEMARVYERRLSSSRSHKTMQSSGDTTKTGFTFSVKDDTSLLVAEPPDSPLQSPNNNLQDRWSWTNSQAPATPRMYAPSLRSSISSLPRFRTIKSWVKTERIEEERPKTSHTMASKPMLKNKASLPTLAPPPIAKKMSKRNGRTSVVLQKKSHADVQAPTTS